MKPGLIQCPTVDGEFALALQLCIQSLLIARCAVEGEPPWFATGQSNVYLTFWYLLKTEVRERSGIGAETPFAIGLKTVLVLSNQAKKCAPKRAGRKRGTTYNACSALQSFWCMRSLWVCWSVKHRVSSLISEYLVVPCQPDNFS